MPPLRFTKDDFARNLAKGNLLVPFLERFDEWDRPFDFHYKPKLGDDGWHPSGDCCPSAFDLWEKATGQGEEDVISPTLQRTFLVGHFWHQIVQDALVRMGFADLDAIELTGKKVWGRIDNPAFVKGDATTESMQEYSGINPTISAPWHYATGSGDVAPLVLPNWEGILDIKTMHEQAFNGVVKSGLLPPRFAEKYEAQINIYMDFFDQPAGMILGVNKASSHFCEIVFERNQDLIDTIYAKWEYVSDCIDQGVPPLPEADEVFALPFNGPVA